MKAHIAKEFTCDLCKRAFSQKENLKRHMNIHADVEKYKCERCSESFSSWSEVRVHVLREHAENPHPCALCDSIFANRWNLSRHMASAHGPTDTTSVNDDEENSMSVCENANSITVGSNNNPEFILGIESNLYVHDEGRYRSLTYIQGYTVCPGSSYYFLDTRYIMQNTMVGGGCSLWEKKN